MADENMEMKQAPKNLLKRLTYTPVRTSAIFMAGATLLGMGMAAGLLVWGGLKDEVDLVLATGFVGMGAVFGGAIMQLITPEPDKPHNAHKAQLNHDLEMAKLELEWEKLAFEQQKMAA